MVSRSNALRRLWRDRLTVSEYQPVTEENGMTGFEEVVVLQDEPCKLSFSTLKTTDQDDTAAAIVQSVKVFCDVEPDIKPGAKLTVTRAGRDYVYCQSGEPGRFTYHQEIMLIPFERWA